MTRRHPFGREVLYTGGLFTGQHTTGPDRLPPAQFEPRHRGCGGIVTGGAKFCNLCRMERIPEWDLSYPAGT